METIFGLFLVSLFLESLQKPKERIFDGQNTDIFTGEENIKTIDKHWHWHVIISCSTLAAKGYPWDSIKTNFKTFAKGNVLRSSCKMSLLRGKYRSQYIHYKNVYRGNPTMECFIQVFKETWMLKMYFWGADRNCSTLKIWCRLLASKKMEKSSWAEGSVIPALFLFSLLVLWPFLYHVLKLQASSKSYQSWSPAKLRRTGTGIL